MIAPLSSGEEIVMEIHGGSHRCDTTQSMSHNTLKSMHSKATLLATVAVFCCINAFISIANGQSWSVEEIIEEADGNFTPRTVIAEGKTYIRIPLTSAEFVKTPGKLTYRLTDPLAGSLVIEPVATTHLNSEVASQALFEQVKTLLPPDSSEVKPGTAPAIPAIWRGWWIGAAEWRFSMAGRRLYMAAFILQRDPGQSQVMGRIIVPEDMADAAVGYVAELMPRWTESKKKPVIPIELME